MYALEEYKSLILEGEHLDSCEDGDALNKGRKTRGTVTAVEPPVLSPSPDPPKRLKAVGRRKLVEKYSLENLLGEKARAGLPQKKVTEEELHRLLQDTDDDTSYEVEDCVPLVAEGFEELATQQLKRICNETQDSFQGAICRFFGAARAYSDLEAQCDYSTVAYLSACAMQPLQLGDKDRLRLSELVLYHPSPEVVTGAYQALANGLRCCPKLQLELLSFVPSYLRTLGAVEAGLHAEDNKSLIADLFGRGQCQGGMYPFSCTNFASFLDLVLLELELRPRACPPRFLSQLCRWCLLMLMDDQLLVFSIALERVFLVCFEELAVRHPDLTEALILGLLSNFTSCDANCLQLSMLAQSLLLDAFPVASKILEVNFKLQKSRAMLGLMFLERSLNPTAHVDNMAPIPVDDLLDSALRLLGTSSDGMHPLKVSLTMDYQHFNYQLRLLHHILCSAFFTPAHLPTLEKICDGLKHLHGQIADGGDVRMDHFEAKDRLQQLYLRLQYSIQKLVLEGSASAAITLE